jgi:hypothetical protein
VVDGRDELHVGESEWVLGWELHVQFEDTAFVWALLWALEGELPVHDGAQLLHFVVAKVRGGVLGLFGGVCELLIQSFHFL